MFIIYLFAGFGIVCFVFFLVAFLFGSITFVYRDSEMKLNAKRDV